jgi:two-component system, chemotaxis family, sensor kinase CheA
MSSLRDSMRQQMLQTFLAEARDLVVELDAGLREMRAGDHGAELVSRLFRAAHSIKGSGGMFGFAPLVGFTHVVENLLDRVRTGHLAATEALVIDLQAGCDHIADLVEVLVARDGTLDEATLARDATLREALARHDGAVEACLHRGEAPAAVAVEPDEACSCDAWHISVRFGPDVFRYGINPLSFLRDLEELGEVVRVVTLAEGMPSLEDFDPETCHLGFEIDLRTDCERARIADVFDFVADCSQIHILPPRSRVADFVEMIRQLPEPDARLGELLVRAGTLTRAEVDAALAEQARAHQPRRRAGHRRSGRVAARRLQRAGRATRGAGQCRAADGGHP